MHLTVSYGDYIVALEQSQEAKVANRKYHPFMLQETTFAVLQEVSLCIDHHLLEQSVIPFQRKEEVIIETIAEGISCNVKSPCAKSVKTYIQKYYLTLKNKTMRKLAFTNLMRLETLFLEMITFYSEKVCQEVIEKLPKLKYVNRTFIH